MFKFDERLRSVPVDEMAFLRSLRQLCNELYDLEDPDPLTWIQLAGIVAVKQRILGDLNQAEKILKEALERCQSIVDPIQRKRKITQQQIRLGHVYQFQERFELSNSLFAELEEQCRSDPELDYFLPFVLQHSGKNQFDQQNYLEALRLFEQTLTMRRTRGVAKDQIESTEWAIEVTRRRLAEQM